MTSHRPRSDRLLLSRVRNAVLASRSSAPSDPLLVGVSGGPDSLCLIHLLSRLQGRLPCRLHVVHVQHGLRPGDDPADAAFVAGFSRGLGIECTVEECDTEGYRRRHPEVTSIEAAARSVRYGRFSERAAALGASTVAVAHTADDQVETVLMRLFRGSGVTGLAGMRWLSQWTEPGSGFTLHVLRPMLDMAKAETIAYCARQGIAFRHDPSNASPRFTRNRVRQDVLPVIRSVYPGVNAAILRLAAMSQAEDDFWNSEVDRHLPPDVDHASETRRLPRSFVLELPVALRARLLRRIYEGLMGHNPDARVLDLIMHAAASGAGKHVDLPGGVCMETTHDQLVLGRPAVVPPISHPSPVSLAPAGEVTWDGWAIRSELLNMALDGLPADVWTAVFDGDRIAGPLLVRGRRLGDRMVPMGMVAAKKIQDILVDARIPRQWRDQIPVVEGGGQILWVAGVRVSGHARVTDSTRKALRLTAVPASPILAQLIADSRQRSL